MSSRGYVIVEQNLETLTIYLQECTMSWRKVIWFLVIQIAHLLSATFACTFGQQLCGFCCKGRRRSFMCSLDHQEPGYFFATSEPRCCSTDCVPLIITIAKACCNEMQWLYFYEGESEN